MRVINVDGRLAIERAGGAVDVERASAGEFSSKPQDALDRWDDFRGWADRLENVEGEPFDPAQLRAPVGRPRQIFAIGLNYRAHAEESGVELPDTPMVFTKFASSIAGPYDEIVLPPGNVDWEAELVAVIGRRAESVPQAGAWEHVAGLTAGQDLSERALQIKPPAPQQFSLAKSHPGFSPLGPALVTPDEFANPDDLEIECRVDGEQMQKARTDDLIFSVPALVAYLSSILPLLPGDLIFTGTPSGVGFARDPQRYLEAGEEITTFIEGIGTMRHKMVAKKERP
jgi:2,4-didehydro-3-deoxy-L-rhamnonate hydrolase